GDRSAADDLLQDTYYRLLRANAPTETDAHRRHYLFRIATNLAADRARRQRTRPLMSDPAPARTGGAAAEAARRRRTGADAPRARDRIGAASAEAALDRRMALDAALAQLRVRERAMIWLAYTQGASHEEIARMVGLRTSSVKPLLLRARRRLAELLGRPHRG